MKALNADLHCHSTVSDGLLAPADLVRRAHAHGVELLALTDHDELGGLAEARAAADSVGLRFVDGVEVSVSWGDDQTVHIVGLGVRPTDSALSKGLLRVRNGRDARAGRIAGELAKAGIDGAYEGALRHVGNPALISRAHFARYIVERGFARDVKSVFDHWLAKGKPGAIFAVGLLELSLKVLLGFVFLHYWGLPGLAWSAVLAFAFEKIGLIWYLEKRLAVRTADWLDWRWYSAYLAALLLAFVLA